MTTHDALERRLSSDELGPIRAALEQLEQTVPLNDAVALIQCIQGWQKASELTCNHIALLVCGDIALALRLLKREVASESVVDRDAKLHDVVHYVLSKPFLEARTALNLAIDRGERTSADS